MDSSVQLILRKIIAVGTAVMLVVTLAAIAVVKADHDKAKATNVASGNNANSSSDYGPAGSDQTQGGDQSTAAQGASGGGTTGASGATGGGGAAAAGPKGAAAGPKDATAAAGGCKDYNPDIGVFCDHILVGGTTVLSGPLAVYGDQGLKGGLAWQTYFNTVVAPAEHLRQAKLPRRRCSTCSACTTSTRSSTWAA
jgi:hypothetical protein